MWSVVDIEAIKAGKKMAVLSSDKEKLKLIQEYFSKHKSISSRINFGSIITELSQLKSFIFYKLSTEIDELHRLILTYLPEKIPNILLLCEYYYAIPCSNAEVER